MRELLSEDVAWIVRRLPKLVVNALRLRPRRLFLAGGFVRACIARETVSDVDLFAPTKETAAAVADELAKARGVKVYATDNAYTVKLGDLPVQVIHRWTFDDPCACVASFDFTIASAAVWCEGEEGGKAFGSCCDDRFYADLAARRLVYRSPIRNEDAGGSILRVLKFYQRGYRVTLPSLGAVVARLVNAIDFEKVEAFEGVERERRLAKVATALLVEVDPNTIIGDESVGDREHVEQGDAPASPA